MPGEENVNTAAGALLRLFLVSALGVIAGDCGIAKIQRSDVLNLIRKPGHFCQYCLCYIRSGTFVLQVRLRRGVFMIRRLCTDHS